VKRGKLFVGIAASLLVSAAALPGAAMAQMSSPGYKFLDAIKKRDGAEVDKALGPTGTPTIINTQDVSSGDTALHIVVARRDLEWLRFLLARGAEPNKANTRGVRPLAVAVSLGWLEGADQLIAKGARVNDPGETGETPLITAVHQRDIEMVRLLIKAGANPARADNSGRTAKDYAALMGSESAIAQAVAAATKAAEASKAKTYGPSF
jgi:ankyrin repeat protein